MKFDRKHLLLYAIADSAGLAASPSARIESLAVRVESAIRGGVSCVQLREKHLAYGEFLPEAKRIKEICDAWHIPLIINDDYRIAAESGADGVHLGQDDGDISLVRAEMGEDFIIGATAKTIAQARTAAEKGADYIGCGAVFGSVTKPDAIPMSLEVLISIRQAVDIPMVAIGGIQRNNILRLEGLGLDGVAVVSGLFRSDDIEREAARLRMLAEKVVASSHQRPCGDIR
jgi:thiamine-phosphate pyrophosphorylase